MMSTKKESAAVATQSSNRENDNTARTQIQVVLDELEQNREDGITSWDMITKHHITRTAAHICMLKKMGHKIESKNETKDGVTYSRYWLEDDAEEDWRQM